jgi:hypothetical protein
MRHLHKVGWIKYSDSHPLHFAGPMCSSSIVPSDFARDRPDKATLYIVTKDYSLYDHIEDLREGKLDRRYAPMSFHPPIGDVFLYAPELITTYDNGWWHGAILREDEVFLAWIHPYVIDPVSGSIGVDADNQPFTLPDFVQKVPGFADSDPSDTLFMHCHILGSDISRDHTLNFHCGTCMCCQIRFMQSEFHVPLLLKAIQHLGCQGRRGVCCLCAHGKHRSYSMAWFLTQLTECHQSHRFTRVCRGSLDVPACTAATNEMIVHTFLSRHHCI